MNKKLLFPAAVVVILVVAAGFLAARKGAQHPAESENAPGNQLTQSGQESPAGNPPVSATPVPSGEQAPPVAVTPAPSSLATGIFSGAEGAGESVDTQVFEVAYDGTGFTPANLSIKLGDVVVFKNNSGTNFWPASSPHPAHTDYPEFDAKRPVAAGSEFDFKFTKVGTWKYHDHLNSAARGSITVTQ